MSITPVTASMALKTNKVVETSPVQPSVPKKDFKEVLSEAKESDGFQTDLSFHKDIVKLQKDLINGREIPARELILYQIKVGQYGMRVELVSKLAESAMSTLRKFQGA